jgi:hypothetical protein
MQEATTVTTSDARLLIQRASGVGDWATAESMLAGGYDPQRVKSRLDWYRETYPKDRFRVTSQLVTTSTTSTPLEW